jgi:hypothetical protein
MAFKALSSFRYRKKINSQRREGMRYPYTPVMDVQGKKWLIINSHKNIKIYRVIKLQKLYAT